MPAVISYNDKIVVNNPPIELLQNAGAYRPMSGSISELNNLPQDKRVAGMLASTNSGETFYVLKPQPWSYTDSDWQELTIVPKTQEIKFSDREIPVGAVDSVNLIFTLQHVPVSHSEHVYINGVLQDPGQDNDYSITTNEIIFTEAPLSGSKIKCTYRYI